MSLLTQLPVKLTASSAKDAFGKFKTHPAPTYLFEVKLYFTL